jgi:hypothetical protein
MDGLRATAGFCAAPIGAIDPRRACLVINTVGIATRGLCYVVGYRAVRDTMPSGIPCLVGYHAKWDTMLSGIPC